VVEGEAGPSRDVNNSKAPVMYDSPPASLKEKYPKGSSIEFFSFMLEDD
jgi:hypothetical protein